MSQGCLNGVLGCLKGVPNAFQVFRVYISLGFLGSMILKGVLRYLKLSVKFQENFTKITRVTLPPSHHFSPGTFQNCKQCKRGTLKLKLICKFVAQLYSVHCTVKDPVIS